MIRLKCDIRNTLSARDPKRQEDRVIKSLCEYFNINGLDVHITLENHIANYDFEQKKFKRGRKSQKDIGYFLTEYDKSWNTETINRYLDEWIEKEENEFGRDDSVDQFIEELETEDSIEEFYANFFIDPKGSLERLARALNKN